MPLPSAVLATPAIPPVFPVVNPEVDEGGCRGVVRMDAIMLAALCGPPCVPTCPGTPACPGIPGNPGCWPGNCGTEGFWPDGEAGFGAWGFVPLGVSAVGNVIGG